MYKFIIVLVIAITLGTMLTGCGRQKPLDDREITKLKQGAMDYLEETYPGHQFTVKVEEKYEQTPGLGYMYKEKITATDENGVEFSLFYTFDNNDPLILQFFVKHWTDSYKITKEQSLH